MIVAVDAARWPFPLNWLYLNVLGNIVASLIWGIPTVFVLYRKWTCVAPRCARLATVPVAGTTYHTCRRKHATAEHHQAFAEQHARRYPHAHARVNEGN